MAEFYVVETHCEGDKIETVKCVPVDECHWLLLDDIVKKIREGHTIKNGLTGEVLGIGKRKTLYWKQPEAPAKDAAGISYC